MELKKRPYEYNEKRKEKKELIQHNVTYKKLKIKKKLKKERERERKRTWLIVIRNFDIYFLKCHQRRNYQINGDIYSFLA